MYDRTRRQKAECALALGGYKCHVHLIVATPSVRHTQEQWYYRHVVHCEWVGNVRFGVSRRFKEVDVTRRASVHGAYFTLLQCFFNPMAPYDGD